MEKIISGKVLHGHKLGHELGFPTANIPIEDTDDTVNGVYAATVTLADGSEYKAMAYIGTRPSVNEGRRLAEVSLFDFDGELYGQDIKIELHGFIRPEIRFDSVDKLKAAIEADRTAILKYFDSL